MHSWSTLKPADIVTAARAIRDLFGQERAGVGEPALGAAPQAAGSSAVKPAQEGDG